VNKGKEGGDEASKRRELAKLCKSNEKRLKTVVGDAERRQGIEWNDVENLGGSVELCWKFGGNFKAGTGKFH
jgi:hypothetical protein